MVSVLYFPVIRSLRMVAETDRLAFLRSIINPGTFAFWIKSSWLMVSLVLLFWLTASQSFCLVVKPER